MTKQELESAIKNEESIWVGNNEFCTIGIIHLKKCYKPKIEHCYNLLNQKDECYLEVITSCDGCISEILSSHLFKTKEQAQHYARHSNVTRMEVLPFVTFEEFKNGKAIRCFDKNGILIKAYKMFTNNFVFIYGKENSDVYELTEENFYAVYEKCIKLFKGEK